MKPPWRGTFAPTIALKVLLFTVVKLPGFEADIGWGARVDKKLLIAGWSPRIDANSWAAIRVIAFVAGILLAFYVQGILTGTVRLAATIGSVLIGLLGPEAILSRRVDERKANMERDLPDVIDLAQIHAYRRKGSLFVRRQSLLATVGAPSRSSI